MGISSERYPSITRSDQPRDRGSPPQNDTAKENFRFQNFVLSTRRADRSGRGGRSVRRGRTRLNFAVGDGRQAHQIRCVVLIAL